jgi:outer membrane protein insertion porin family
MIIRTLYFLTIFFLASPILNAEIINKIVIDGNKRVSDETIKVYGEIKINQNVSEVEINNILNNLYSTNFFEDVQIQINNNIINIKVIEYPVINQLIIIGEDKKSYKDQLKKLIKLKEKKAFVKPYLTKDIETIKKLYSSLGYNFAKIETKIRTIDENNLDLMIEVERGNQTKISSINFIGNKNIRSNRLKDIIASEENKFWKFISKNTNFSNNLLELDKRLLENYYKSIGFYDIQVSSNIAQINNEGNADISYTINEGTRYRINKISTNVDKVFDKEIFFSLNKVFNEYAGEYYSPFKVKELLEELDQIIEFNNLQFVEHNVQEVVQNDSINIIFNIFEGEKTLVERINITGNTITNEGVIRGELILDEGDPFINLNLEKSINEIRQRSIFKNVTYKVIEGSKKNLKIINIDVEEQPTGEISAGAGIGTTGGTFAFTVTENNWLGEGKNVSFDVQVDKEKLAGKVIYIDPNYDFLGNSLSYSLSSTSNDKPDMGFENTIVSAAVGTSFQQYKDVNVNIGLAASYDDLKTEDSASASLKKQSGNFSELAANYGFSFDKRDRVFMPTSGSIIGFSQELPLYADKAYLGNTFTSSTYKSLNEENIIGAAKFYLTTINAVGSGEDVRISKRKGLSSRRLRGFEKNKIGPVDGTDHVGGNYAAAVNFESNLPNLLPESSNTDISLFLDFGNVWGVDYDSSVDKSNKIRSSTGVAASWSSPLGPMTFIISQNLSKASTDKTEGFTFNLGTTF